MFVGPAEIFDADAGELFLVSVKGCLDKSGDIPTCFHFDNEDVSIAATYQVIRNNLITELVQGGSEWLLLEMRDVTGIGQIVQQKDGACLGSALATNGQAVQRCWNGVILGVL